MLDSERAMEAILSRYVEIRVEASVCVSGDTGAIGVSGGEGVCAGVGDPVLSIVASVSVEECTDGAAVCSWIVPADSKVSKVVEGRS